MSNIFDNYLRATAHQEKVEEGIRLLEDIARKIYDDDRRKLAMYTIGAICNRFNIKEEE